MKKNWDLLLNFWQYRKSKFFLRMKISMILLLVGVMHLSANTFSQTKVSLNMKDATVQEVFSNLEKMTNYTFLYKLDLVNKCGKVNVDATDQDFSQLLLELLNPLGLSFTIDDQVVVITASKAKDDVEKELTIKGRVFMKDSTGVPGATVILKGTSTGVITNMAGEFTITIPYTESPVLIFSFLGMKTREVRYVGQKEMMVLMEEDVKAMDEVIVTGYQRIRKSDMVGSTNSVKREDLFFNGTNSIEQMLQGKLPGMVVMNTSGLVGKRQKVRVRGTSTLLGNQEPVWVVDGIIQEDPLPFKTRELDALGNISQDNFDMVKDFVGNAISWLNPNDIQDITVLKDASATAIYGVKAANGVIVITTKKGERGRLSLNYSGNFSVGEKLNYDKLEIMNSKQRVDLSREAYERGAQVPNDKIGYIGLALAYQRGEISYDEFDRGAKALESVNTNWFDVLYQTPFSHSHSLSFSGGNENSTYYASLGYSSNQNTAKGNSQTSYTGRLNLSSTFWNKLRLNVSLSGSHTETKAFANGVDPFNYAINANRAIACYEEDGSLFYYASGDDGYDYNILNELKYSVPANSTVVGVKARVVKIGGERVSTTPSFDLDQIHMPDPVAQELCQLTRRVYENEQRIRKAEEDAREYDE